MFQTRDFKSRVSTDFHLSKNSIPAGTHFFKCVYRPLFTHAPHIRKSEVCPVQWVYTKTGDEQYALYENAVRIRQKVVPGHNTGSLIGFRRVIHGIGQLTELWILQQPVQNPHINAPGQHGFGSALRQPQHLYRLIHGIGHVGDYEFLLQVSSFEDHELHKRYL